jgi:DNA-binding NarL/FixJ family response regulator
MKKARLYIKEILNNWYILESSDSLEVLDVLIPVANAIELLRSHGELTDTDLTIIEAYRQGYKYEEISKLTKISRQTISNRIRNIASRIESTIGEMK